VKTPAAGVSTTMFNVMAYPATSLKIPELLSLVHVDVAVVMTSVSVSFFNTVFI
jgi:hypothetical protein